MPKRTKPGKINLLIDTNALNHLSKLEFNQKKLIKLVLEYFNVYICQVVFEEFCNGIDKASQDNKATRNLLKKNERIILHPTKITPEIEETLSRLKYYGSLSEKDRGERVMVSTAIEMVYQDKLSQSILLTDDQTAIDKFLDTLNKDFHFGNIWETLDLISFLYFKLKINYDEAEEAIRDLVTNTSTSIKKYRLDKNITDVEARQKMLKMNLKRLGNIKEMHFVLTGGKR
jgi:hypothetical protein